MKISAPRLFRLVIDAWPRVLITLGLLCIVRFGFQVPVPGMSPEYLSGNGHQGSFFGLLSALSGGAIGQTPLFALGLLPWISSSIILWMLSTTRLPLRVAQRDGAGKVRRIEQWARVVAVPVAALQALILYVSVFLTHAEMFSGSAGAHPFGTGLIVVLALVTGAIAVMWLGEMITKFGIGHGMLVIVAGGIVARIPHAIDVLVSTEHFWSTLLLVCVIWTITSVIAACAYVAGRKVLHR